MAKLRVVGGDTGHRKSQRPHRAKGNPETTFANSLGSKLVSVTEGTVWITYPLARPSSSYCVPIGAKRGMHEPDGRVVKMRLLWIRRTPAGVRAEQD